MALGNSCQGNLWKAVNVAKNLVVNNIPCNLTLAGIPIATKEIPNAFARFFNEKVTLHAQNTRVDPGVYNGKNKIIVQNRNFMQYNKINIMM